MVLQLAADDRCVLASMLRATALSADLVRRARVILVLADGQTYAKSEPASA